MVVRVWGWVKVLWVGLLLSFVSVGLVGVGWWCVFVVGCVDMCLFVVFCCGWVWGLVYVVFFVWVGRETMCMRSVLYRWGMGACV